jgi:transposase
MIAARRASNGKPRWTGSYVIRTTLPTASASGEQAVRHYKELANVERVFRSLNGVNLRILLIHHHLEERVCAHPFRCMLAHYVANTSAIECAPMNPLSRPAATHSSAGLACA